MPLHDHRRARSAHVPAIAVALLALAIVRPAYAADCPRLEERLSAAALASVGLTDEQLARLNAVLCENASRQVPKPDGERSRMIGFEDSEWTGRVVGHVEGWEPGVEFKLANGQVWKVLRGRYRLARAVDGPTVRLVPGIAGRWFLEIDPDAPKARVYRVD